MRRRRSYSSRERQLVFATAMITLLLYLLLQCLYNYVVNESWHADTLDWVYVPSYSVADFVRTIENIENASPGSLVVRQVELSGPPDVRGRKTVKELHDLLAIAAADPDQIRVMRFLVEGPLSYYQFAEFNKLGAIQDITRRYLFTWVSVFKKS
jgi:hypothetical protein